MKRPSLRTAFAVLFVLQSAGAQTVRFVQAGAASPGLGTIQAPFASIQVGIAASVNGDALAVAPGTYFEALDFSGKNIDVYGTGGASITTVHAGYLAPVVRFRSGEGPTARMAGFTLRLGLADSFDFGGGISVDGASPTVEDCIIESCNGGDGGGGIGCNGGAPRFRRCLIQFNNAGSSWPGVGGVLMMSQAGRFENCSIVGNFGPDGYIDCVGSCCSGGHGGTGGVQGIGPAGGSATIFFQFVNCLIVANHGGDATYGHDGGHGGVFGAMTFANCTIMHNFGGFGPSALTTPKCGYSAGDGGSGGVGGGAVLRNCIVRGNQGGIGGAGLVIPGGSYPPGFAGQNDDFGVGAVSFSNIPGFHAGPGNIDADPQLATYRPTATSPGVDAGNNLVVDLPATDLDGLQRVQHMVVDQGAFESAATTYRGAVGLSSGAPVSTLTVNGHDRTAPVPMNGSATIAMAAPPGGGPAPFLIIGRIGVSAASDLIVLPAGIGELAFAHPLMAAGDLSLFLLADNLLGGPAATASSPAPWAVTLPAPGVAFTFMLQGLIDDSTAVYGCSVTNAVRVDVQ